MSLWLMKHKSTWQLRYVTICQRQHKSTGKVSRSIHLWPTKSYKTLSLISRFIGQKYLLIGCKKPNKRIQWIQSFLLKGNHWFLQRLVRPKKKKKKSSTFWKRRQIWIYYLKSFKYLKTIEKYLNLFMLFIDPLETNLKNKDT